MGALLGLYRKKSLWGLPGSGGTFLKLNFDKRVAQKLRRIILLHIGLVILNVHFPKVRKVIIFMMFGPNGHVHDSHNHFSNFGYTKSLKIIEEEYQTFFIERWYF